MPSGNWMICITHATTFITTSQSYPIGDLVLNRRELVVLYS